MFSSSFGNLLTTDYSYDAEDYYNYIYVVGEDKDDNEVIVEVDQVPEGEARREYYHEARDAKQEYKDENGRKISLSEKDFKAVLRQKGIEKLTELNYKECVDAEVDTGVLRYGVDFDLGDICEIVNRDIGLIWTARITTIDEVYEADRLRVVPRFGDKINLIHVLKREVQR